MFLHRYVRLPGMRLLSDVVAEFTTFSNSRIAYSSLSRFLISIADMHTSAALSAPPPKKASGAFKAGMTVTKKKMEVETDPYKLVNYLCGGNYKKESPEIKLAPNSDYPDWLFSLRTDGDPTIDELDPNSIEYWLEVRRLKNIANRRVQKSLKGKLWLFKKDNRYQSFIRQKKQELIGQAL